MPGSVDNSIYRQINQPAYGRDGGGGGGGGIPTLTGCVVRSTSPRDAN